MAEVANPVENTRHRKIETAITNAVNSLRLGLSRVDGEDLIIHGKDGVTNAITESAIKLSFLSGLNITDLNLTAQATQQQTTVKSEQESGAAKRRIDVYIYDPVAKNSYIVEIKFVHIGYVFSGFGPGFITPGWWKDTSKLQKGCELISTKNPGEIRYSRPSTKPVKEFETIGQLIERATIQAKQYATDIFKTKNASTLNDIYYCTLVVVGTSVFGSPLNKL